MRRHLPGDQTLRRKRDQQRASFSGQQAITPSFGHSQISGRREGETVERAVVAESSLRRGKRTGPRIRGPGLRQWRRERRERVPLPVARLSCWGRCVFLTAYIGKTIDHEVSYTEVEEYLRTGLAAQKPRRSSSWSRRCQSRSTFTRRSRYTGPPKYDSSSVRASSPTALSAAPPFPITMPFCEGRST